MHNICGSSGCAFYTFAYFKSKDHIYLYDITELYTERGRLFLIGDMSEYTLGDTGGIDFIQNLYFDVHIYAVGLDIIQL